MLNAKIQPRLKLSLEFQLYRPVNSYFLLSPFFDMAAGGVPWLMFLVFLGAGAISALQEALEKTVIPLCQYKSCLLGPGGPAKKSAPFSTPGGYLT